VLFSAGVIASGLFAACLPAVFSAVLASAPAAPPVERQCTKMDCSDQLMIRLRSLDGRPPTDIDIEMNIDGNAVTCKPNPSGGQTNPFQCEQNVTVVHQEFQRCRGSICKGTGSFEQIIEIPSTPKRVPQYERVRPNGRGCLPVCRQATRTWRYH
jgi:hypothetical protein